MSARKPRSRPPIAKYVRRMYPEIASRGRGLSTRTCARSTASRDDSCSDAAAASPSSLSSPPPSACACARLCTNRSASLSWSLTAWATVLPPPPPTSWPPALCMRHWP
eukprot:361194-Chlamydomonas_euryale.AAC.2